MAARFTFRADCLSCLSPANLCVTCVTVFRIPPQLDAASLFAIPCDARVTRRAERGTYMRKRILIVDNDEKVLIALERALEQEGYDTHTAWDLPEGLEAIADASFDLLLVGDHPPELNCERVLKVLGRERLRVPVIVMHSRARHPFAEAFVKHLGAAGVVCKWNEQEIVEAVTTCFALPPQFAPREAPRTAAAS